MTDQITYTNTFTGKANTLFVGAVPGITREPFGLDISLERAVAINCPLIVSILIRADGSVVLRRTFWDYGRDDTLWQFDIEPQPGTHPSPAQLATLEQMALNAIDLPGALNGALNKAVTTWAFQDDGEDERSSMFETLAQ